MITDSEIYLIKSKHKKELILNGKHREYVEFIQFRVSLYFKMNVRQLTGKSKDEIFLYPRYIAIDIVNRKTGLEGDSMYFFNRDRTSWYNATMKLKDVLKKQIYLDAYDTLLMECSKEFFLDYRVDKVMRNSPKLSHQWEIYKEVENQL
jgi:chromosomal replication initiation ATPase DnaA